MHRRIIGVATDADIAIFNDEQTEAEKIEALRSAEEKQLRKLFSRRKEVHFARNSGNYVLHFYKLSPRQVELIGNALKGN